MAIKIAIITSTRAEYGLLQPLIREMTEDSYFQAEVVVTGTHLLDKFGNTLEMIIADGIPVAHKIPIMGEEEESVSTIIGRGILAFSRLYEEQKYDAILVLGDRYELFSFCIPAMMLNIPIIHIHGGEKTEGAVDERIRHSITKMASLHFPTIQEYARRIIQMGESPEYVHPVGALGIDNIMAMQPLPREELEKELGIDFNNPVALVTFHPVTLNSADQIREQGEELFKALLAYDMHYIVTMPNNDSGSAILQNAIGHYVQKYPDRFIYRKSLGQKRYLSILSYVRMVIGNSSSGLIEVPSFRIPTINIGDRQRGRFAPATVIHCDCTYKDILDAIRKGDSLEFRESITDYDSPFGDGAAAKKMVRIIKETDFHLERMLKKEFFDVDYQI